MRNKSYSVYFYLSNFLILFGSIGVTILTHASEPSLSVDLTVQKTRDEMRRQILQEELVTEEKSMDGTKQALSEAVNLGRPTAKLAAIREDISRHAKNISALNNELASLEKTREATKSKTHVRLVGRANTLPPDLNQSVPFWDVYRRSKIETDGDVESKLLIPGIPATGKKEQKPLPERENNY